MNEILNAELPIALAVAILAIIILVGLLLEAGHSRECHVCRRRWAWWIRGHPGLAHVELQLCRRCKQAHDRRARSVVRYPSRWTP